MTDEQIIEMARQTGCVGPYEFATGLVMKRAIKFAKLVAQRERLLCSKFLQETLNPLKPEYIDQIEEGIWND